MREKKAQNLKAQMYAGLFIIHSPESPCELYCRPENSFFAAKLANSVINGTPCGKDTRDICIDGICQVSGSCICSDHIPLVKMYD